VRHQRLVRRLLLEIELYLKANPRTGGVFPAPLDVVLSHFDVVEPDLLFVAGDQTNILTEKNIQGAPAFASTGWSTLNSTRCRCSGRHRKASWRASSNSVPKRATY